MNVEEIPTFKTNPIILGHFGSGYPLFFDFIKYMIFFLLLLLLSTGAYNIFSNVMLGNGCKDLEE